MGGQRLPAGIRAPLAGSKFNASRTRAEQFPSDAKEQTIYLITNRPICVAASTSYRVLASVVVHRK